MKLETTVYVHRKCVICESDQGKLIVKQNFEPRNLTKFTFSARRLPDKLTFSWVRCEKCGLVRSDPVVDLDLDELYGSSEFTYSDELKGLGHTYDKLFRNAVGKPDHDSSLLEVGAGNGFFLELALRAGFSKVLGLEPSLDAVRKAPTHLQKFLTVGMIETANLGGNYSSVVMFHVLDHLPEPVSALEKVRSLTKSGGSILVAVHNCRSWSARLFRSASPIYDVEHCYLFDKSTIRLLLMKSGYKNVKVGTYWNTYSFAYLFQLLPLPLNFKRNILNTLLGTFFRRLKLTLPLGNMWARAEV